MAGMQWARLQANLNIRLRRGAWYRIRQVGPLQAVLEVRGQPLQVPSAFLQIVETPPRRWTVVPRPDDAVRVPPSWGDRSEERRVGKECGSRCRLTLAKRGRNVMAA